MENVLISHVPILAQLLFNFSVNFKLAMAAVTTSLLYLLYWLELLISADLYKFSSF